MGRSVDRAEVTTQRRKASIIDGFVALLRRRLGALEQGSADAQAGARVDGSHRPATRGERGAVSEQAALAHGLRVRAAALETALHRLADVPRGPTDRGGPGALVQLEDEEGARSWWAVLPGGQGDTVDDATIVSPESPVAQALRGAEAGDVVRLRRGGVLREHEVLQVG